MSDKWKEDDSSKSLSSSPAAAVSSRRKFEDEEEDSDVLESWDAAEDSEVEREKIRVAEELKAKAEAEALANKKSKAQRIAENKAEKARKLAEEGDESGTEDPATRRKRLKEAVQESDMKFAVDLFDGISNNNIRKTHSASVVETESKDPTSVIDLSTLPLFEPRTKLEFEKLRNALIPAISKNTNEPHYCIFLQEFTKQLAKELPSDQIKKIASTLTTLSNEKMKEEKLADKGGKKTKAAKTKVKLVASKNIVSTPDVQAYDDDYEDDDFM